MDKLENLIKAAQERGAAERLLHSGGEAIIAAGAEIAHKTAQMDETGTLATAEQIGVAGKNISKAVNDILR